MIFLKIKETKSLCPECGKPLDAEVFDEDGKVLIKKTCDEHGEFINTYWSDNELYDQNGTVHSINFSCGKPLC